MDYTSLIIKRFGNDYVTTSGSKPHMRYNCPFCESKRGKADSDKKLYVNIATAKFLCFKCGSHGSLANRRLYSTYGVYDDISFLYRNNIDEEDSNIESDEENMFYVPNIKIKEGSIAYNYCIDRGISADSIEYYNIRLGTGELFGRIVIPNNLYFNGDWTDMYSSRTYINQEPKYLNPPGAFKSKSVFNLHRIENRCKNLYIQEGVITSIMAGRDSVAIYGCHPSDSQIDAIVDKNPENIYVSLDNDEAGRIPNIELAEVLSNRCVNSNVYYVVMPEGIDAADIGERAYKEYVAQNHRRVYNGVYNNLFNLFD